MPDARRIAGLGRRDFLELAGAAGLGVITQAQAAPSETAANAEPQPTPRPSRRPIRPTSSSKMIAWGAPFVFGVVGDGINPIIEALRKRQDRIRYVGVRHEEAAAFMASGIAKHTGRLGVCLGTTGPGAIHLMNGLYDAHFDGPPDVTITGTTFHDLIGTRFQQGVSTTALMQDVALYNVEVTGPDHALIVANRACRAALGHRGVAHLTVDKDVHDEARGRQTIDGKPRRSYVSSKVAFPGGVTAPTSAAPPKFQFQSWHAA